MGEIPGPWRHPFSTAFGDRREHGPHPEARARRPALPERYRHPEGWPAAMREEYGADQGLSAARRHREALIAGFRNARRVLDDFAPDVVLIWGDDQVRKLSRRHHPAVLPVGL